MASDQNRSNPENQSYRSRYHPKGRGRGQNTIGSQAPSTSLPRRAVVRQGRERDFSHIASVSRSSGLDKDGDALKDKRTQEEYRAFIEQKLSEYWRLFPIQDRSGAADVEKSRQEKEGNILIQLRSFTSSSMSSMNGTNGGFDSATGKLREGLSASRRHDAFAIESYETSLHLSIIFNSAAQTTSIASHLPELYRSTGTTTSPWTIVLTLLHDLALHGPSQRTFYERRKDFDKLLVEESLKSWLGSLAHALHRCDFSRFQLLSRLESVESLFPRQSRSEPPGQAPSLPMEALAALLQRLRSQARTTSWRVMRSAYRGEFGSNSRAWFARQLFFDAESSPGREELLAWLIECERKGEVFRKEGADFEERWAVLVKR